MRRYYWLEILVQLVHSYNNLHVYRNHVLIVEKSFQSYLVHARNISRLRSKLWNRRKHKLFRLITSNIIHLLSYVLWNCAICWKFPKITSLLSRTTLGTAGLSIVFIYLSTTACRSRPNSSSVSTSSRMTALEWKIYELTDRDQEWEYYCLR